MGRGRQGGKPFRFILNNSQATACNTYLLLYPKPRFAPLFEADPGLIRVCWEFLNQIDPEELLGYGRVYGGGLHKLEPKELRGFPAQDLIAVLSGTPTVQRELELFYETAAE